MSTVWPEGWRSGTREAEVRLDGWCEGVRLASSKS